jgi:hypothetical protein
MTGGKIHGYIQVVCYKFSKVSALVCFPYNTTVELTFENL